MGGCFVSIVKLTNSLQVVKKIVSATNQVNASGYDCNYIEIPTSVLELFKSTGSNGISLYDDVPTDSGIVACGRFFGIMDIFYNTDSDAIAVGVRDFEQVDDSLKQYDVIIEVENVEQ